MGKSRGSIAFFGTYRPPVPLDIFSVPADPLPCSAKDELLLTDGESYNQNGQAIPAAALKELLTFLGKKNPKLASECGATPKDAETGRVTGMVFVSERDGGLETLQVALIRGFAAGAGKAAAVKVFSLGDVYGSDTFGGVRMEDSGRIAGGFRAAGGAAVGHSLVYVSTKAPVSARRAPWTVVYKTSLGDGRTERLTPPDQYDLSPAVSPSGKLVAVANFQQNRWSGEIENLKTDIVVMNVDKRAQGGRARRRVVRDGGWPTWASDNVIFFHRGLDTTPPTKSATWAVFRYDIAADRVDRVTPEGMDAMTPAAISEHKVAVATVRKRSLQVEMHVERVEAEFRHIEIFETPTTPGQPPVPEVTKITQRTRPEADHYNPFVLELDGGRRLGYHRCRTDKLVKIKTGGGIVQKRFDKVKPPQSHADVGLFRVTGVFPTVSKSGKKLAFVDNEFKAVWLADSRGLRIVHKVTRDNSVFCTSWNQNEDLDTLYVCQGPAFSIDSTVQIWMIRNVSSTSPQRIPLTEDGYNCVFPSSNPEGTRLVFRGSRNRVPGGQRQHKNLFVMDAMRGHTAGVVQLTDGAWTDTHCSWSPRAGCDWVVFSSSGRPEKDVVRPEGEPDKDHGLDPGYFAVYLVNARGLRKGDPPPAPVRVIHSAPTIAGHVNHPVFSPDMRSVVFAADLAGVSADPISMPHFTHSVRPYGDIFSVDLRDTTDIANNRDIQEFHRITHSRYEYSTPAWTASSADDDEDPNAKWKMLERVPTRLDAPFCPYASGEAGEKEGWHMTGHLALKKRCC